MMLKDWLKLADPIGINIRLFSQYSEDDECIWEGSALDIPWIYADKEIGRADGDTEEPIWFHIEKNKYDVNIIVATINIIE